MGAPQLLGRADEITGALEALRSGRPVVLAGEPGVGKSVLARAAIGQLGSAHVAAQCFRATRRMAGLPLAQAVGRELPVGDAEWTAGWLAGALDGAALVIDDLQWADHLTLGAVALLSRAAAVVATVRTGDPGSAAALTALAEVGATTLDLLPLTTEAAVALARTARPELSPAQAAQVAERAGNNPLLVQELASGGSPSLGLRRTVVARLRGLGDDAWTGFGMLALADTSVPESLMPAVPVLTEAGLVVVEAARARPRHPLLAEVVAAELAEGPTDELTRVHRRLAEAAETTGDDGLAARHWAGAGVPERARDLALAAAGRARQPGDRAELLHLAAMSSTGPEAGRLARDAVGQLVSAGLYDRATQLLGVGDPGEEPADRAGWLALRGSARWNTGDRDGALADFEAGVALAPAGSPEAVRVAIELARAVVIGAGAGDRGLHLARAAFADAVASGHELARATATLGSAEAYFDLPGSTEHLRTGMELAAAEGDVSVEMTAAHNYTVALEGAGRAREAVAAARAFALRAGELRLRGFQTRLEAVALDIAIRVGDDLPGIVDQARALLAGSLEIRTVDDVEVPLALALIDLGRTDEAIASLRPPPEDPTEDDYGFGRTWAHAEAHLWAGDHAEAARLAQRAIDGTSPDWRMLLPAITLGHAQVGLGTAPADRVWPDHQMALLAAAPVELAALARQLDDPAGAAGLFAEAAGLWTGNDTRAALRCHWLAAELDPSDETAIAALTELEAELEAREMEQLLRQVRRALRSRGVRRSAPRGRSGALTAREREVLDLVAAGLSTKAISARLGIAPSTVAAQVSSARAKLGSASRIAAAGERGP